MEIQGTALATCLTHFLNLVAFAIYTEKFTCDKVRKEAWFLPTKETLDLSGLLSYLKLGLPSTGMVCLEWWSIEVMTFLTGFISI